MSILKLKVSRAAELNKKKLKTEDKPPQVKKEETDSQTSQQDFNSRPKRTRKPVQQLSPTITFPPKGSTSCNNIMKNYSQALTKFALSEMAVAYLAPLLADANVNIEEFRTFIRNKKEKVNCIKGLRELLLVQEVDSEDIVCLKNAFKQISVIFLKFFCVNWIFHSRVSDKITHLNYRFKILRRIKNPEYFTYLEGFSDFK